MTFPDPFEKEKRMEGFELLVLDGGVEADEIGPLAICCYMTFLYLR